jgi:glycosyltransferase involved in cell wall biosynthesis
MNSGWKLSMRTPLIYALHSGELYGTERMALWTAEGLAKELDPVIMAPAGPALTEARRLGLGAVSFRSAQQFALALRPFLAKYKSLVLMATGVVHSLAGVALNQLYKRNLVHIHLVHGGTDERLSYGRKRWLNRSDVTFVAVSKFVRQRLIANGVSAGRIAVIENFLPEGCVHGVPRRPAFTREGIHNIIVVSRVDPIKRVDLLLDAFDRSPELRDLPVRVLGSGWDLQSLQERAARSYSRVVFAGYRPDVAENLAQSDLLVHLCPCEPFGLAVLEAMAAGIPVLVPDSGGAGSLIEDGVSGFHFRADDPGALAETLARLRTLSADRLNGVVRAADSALSRRFSAAARLDDYRELLRERLQ